MSRIGKKLIEIPTNVTLEINKNKISIKGPFGVLEKTFLDLFNFQISEANLKIELKTPQETYKAYHGLTRTLIQNMIIGVTLKFSKNLVMDGVGYKFQIDKNLLIINAGFTHSVIMKIPEDLEVKLESTTKLIISGIDKEKVGSFSAKIRSIRPPEPYKGKGIAYKNEIIRKKVGKKAK
jgi:large subunit ribosomal protein L6